MSDHTGQRLPSFSIIIPTHARPKQLALCLDSIAHIDYPKDRFKVIVVADGTESPPESVVSTFHNRLNITLITQPHAGPAMARNTGALHAESEFLAFTDDDCAPASGWLQALASKFISNRDSMIGGQVINALRDNIYSIASQLLVDYLYNYYNSLPDRACFFTSNNLALSLENFLKIKGFDTSFRLAAGEDRELCDRWLKHEFRMTYVPEAIVYHSHPLSFRKFWRQHFNYGRGAFNFRNVRSKRSKESIKLEPLSFYLELLRYPFLRRHERALLIMLLLMVSQIANLAGFLWQYFKTEKG